MKARRWWVDLRRTWNERPGRIRMGRQGLRFRVYLLVSIGVLGPAALVAGVSWTRLRELDDELVGARRHAAVAVAEHIDEELTADLEVLQRLASAPQLGLDRDRLESARTLLRAAYLHSQFKAGMFLLDAEGRVLAEEPRASRSAAPPADLPDLRRTLADGKPRLTDLVGVEGEGHTYALVSVMDWRGQPVGRGGRDRGGVGAAASPRAAPPPARRDGHADLVDGKGMVLASTDRQRLHRPAECRGRLSEQVAKHEASSGALR